jgi:hypothetical protein
VGMKRVCAWCQRPLNNEPDRGTPVSHGICDPCFENVVLKITVLSSLRSVIQSPVEADGKGNFGRQPRSPRFQ